MNHTLVAVFNNRTDAQNAMNELVTSGFKREHLHLSGTGTGNPPAPHAAAGGSGLRHFFSGLFGEENKQHVSRYEGAVARGQHVVTLSAETLPDVERAADIVERYRPVDIDEHADGVLSPGPGALLRGDKGARQGGTQPAPSRQSARAAPAQRQAARGGASQQRESGTGANKMGATTTAASIPVVEEQLKVSKREVQRGGVRIYSRIVTTPVHETIDLREEHVGVERHKVDQPLGPGETAAFREQTIEMRESAEEAVVEKTARITEEVTIGKQVSERQQQIEETVRHTEIGIEHLEGSEGWRNDDSDYRSHFNSTYSGTGDKYDDYAPAYAYGAHMAGSSKYSGRRWDEVESELHLDWEARHGGASTWDRMKSAIRHGWDRMTGGRGGRA